jgi:hypothetical protein
VECRDSDIFITIPCLLILKSLEDEAAGKDICLRFFPPMFKSGDEANKKYVELKDEYAKIKTKICGGNNSISISTGQILGKPIRAKSNNGRTGKV